VKISLSAKCINKIDEGNELITTLNKQKEAFNQALKNINSKPRVLFLMNMQRGNLMAAGTKTGADTMINLVNAQNAVSGFSSYRALSFEIAVAGQPDVILVPSHGATMMGGIEEVTSLPELADTPAINNKNVLVMDSAYLLSFGPRYLQAAAELAALIHPGFVIPHELQKNEISQ
jgi:iron complex transport system substrate-binding protein